MARWFARLAAASGAVVLDAGAPEVDKRAVDRHAESSRGWRWRRGRAHAEPPNTAAARVPLGEPRRVQIGGDARWGRGVRAARRARRLVRSGGVGDPRGVPGSRCMRRQLCSMSVTGADGAARRCGERGRAMAGHGELDLLIELERMLGRWSSSSTTIRGPERYEPRFGARRDRACRGRLARDYAAQLERTPPERGWARAPIA